MAILVEKRFFGNPTGPLGEDDLIILRKHYGKDLSDTAARKIRSMIVGWEYQEKRARQAEARLSELYEALEQHFGPLWEFLGPER